MQTIQLARLKRAAENRRRAINEYGWAVRHRRTAHVIDDLARRCRETCAELTAAMRPFLTEGP